MKTAMRGGGALAVVGLVAWEVARPSLPIPFELAVASRASGTAAWLARLPTAAAALFGMAALYVFLARTTDRRTGAYALAILATAPAWFVHGRAMTGAIAPMAAAAIVLAGLGVAVLDPTATTRARAAGVALALAASAAAMLAERAGAPARGLAIVSGVPAIAVGLAGTLLPTDGRRGRALACAAASGSLVLAAAVTACVAPDGSVATLLLGARAHVPPSAGFEAPVTAIAYGLVPWSPLVPLALSRRPSGAGHLAVVLAAVLAVVAHATALPRSGSAPLVGVAPVCAAVAAMLRGLEGARRPSVLLVVIVLGLGWLVAHDVALSPERVLALFGATDAAVPAAHASASALAVRSSMWMCMVLVSVALLVPREWLPTGRGLAIAGGGVLAGLVLRAHAYPGLLARLSPGVAFDAWARAHREGEPLGLVGVDRRSVAFAPGTAVVAHGDPRSAGRWLATDVRRVTPSTDGTDDTRGRRRFLAVGAAELARVNAEWRSAKGANVPVLAGGEGATLLAVSALAPGERSANPLDGVVLSAPPPMRHPIGATLEDGLDVVAWDLADDRGRAEDLVRARKRVHVRVAVRVREGARPGLAGYCTFLHVDHAPARFAAEHRELPYPMALWRAGDVFVDDFAVELPPHFRTGRYALFWGVGVLPCEDDRRMHVASGPSDGKERIALGTLEVR